VSFKSVGMVGTVLAVLFLVGLGALRATEPAVGQDEPFLKILEGSYDVSCKNVEALRGYYLEDAEIINNGRQVTLEDTIKELKQSLSSLKSLECSYEPTVRARRISKDMAYLVVREIIRLSSEEAGEQQIDQLCTYVFMKTEVGWKISHDHCSSVPGLSI
jgi:ketosteroid isomerase-like protein